MDPVYKIFYGKHPDTCTNEIPTAYIRDVQMPGFKIDSGKPGEPTLESASFTLENINHDGTFRYDTTWFETQSRSQGEGAIIPLQLFFRIQIPDCNVDYIGVYDSKSSGQWRETVRISLKSLMSFLADSNVKMLKEFAFQGSVAHLNADIEGFNDGVDLRGENIIHQVMRVRFLEKQWEAGPGVQEEMEDIFENDNYLKHIGKNDVADFGLSVFPGMPSVGQWHQSVGVLAPRNAYVQMGEITLLTRVQLQAILTTFRPDEFTLVNILSFDWFLAHFNNGIVQDGPNELVVLERGRFYKDNKGSNYVVGDEVELKLFDWSHGYDTDTGLPAELIPADIPTHTYFTGSQYVGGAEINIINDTIYIVQKKQGYFDVLDISLKALASRIFGQFYNTPPQLTDLFEIATAPTQIGRHAFWADVAQFGWLEDQPGKLLVNLAMQTGCYLFVNEKGKITFQERLIHEQKLPTNLPNGTIEIKLEDIRPSGSDEDSRGFESYEIRYKDIIELSNITGIESKEYITKEGVSDSFKLRNSSLVVGNYRTSNLGVPSDTDPLGMPALRHSPASAAMPGPLDLKAFLPTPSKQAQDFAKSFSYPTRIWEFSVDMLKYQNITLGSYCYVDIENVKEVYLLKQVHYDPIKLLIGLQAQFVGVWNG